MFQKRLACLIGATAIAFWCTSPPALAVPAPSGPSCESIAFTDGGHNNTGTNCLASTMYFNNPDPTSNGQQQDKTLNGSPLLGSFPASYIGSGGPAGYDDDFVITANAANTSGTWTYTPDPGQLYPKYVLINSASEFFFIELANTLLAMTSGTWTTCPTAGTLCIANQNGVTQALSHIAFFDGAAPPCIPGTPGCTGGGTGEVPIPGAFLLMGTVLVGGGGFAAWRRRRERSAS